jgi:FkbM family methyltransferase
MSRIAMRAIAERATHRLVICRRLPPPFGQVSIYTSSEGGLRYLRPNLGNVDPQLLRLVTEMIRPGDTIWDIGANVGLFTFAAAAAAGPSGQVLAVEPDATLVRLLRRSAVLNRCIAAVEVFPVAVAADLSVGRFHVARRNRSTSYLDGFGTTQTGGIRSTELVPTVTLDWLAAHFGSPNVIKIDVEGAESEVLSGGADVLKSLPAIICEVASCNSASVAKILKHYEYSLYDGDIPSHLRQPLTAARPATVAFHDSSNRLMPRGPAEDFPLTPRLSDRGHAGTGGLR